MGLKIGYSILIFSTLYQVAIGCTCTINNCTSDVYCPNQRFNELRCSQTECGNKIYISPRRRSYYNIPVRLFITEYLYEGNSVPDGDHEILQLIISLDINGLGLNNTPTFSEMTNLKTLNLSDNNLHVANLSGPAQLNALENVDLSHNNIQTIYIDESQHVYQNLRMLNLSHNFLKNIPGGIFVSLKHLDTLDLSHNYLTIDEYSFEGLRSLQYLYLSQNGISDINLSLFRFSYLKELRLDYNNIEALLVRDFEKLSRLQKLDLGINKICRIEKDTFNSTESLTTLNLNDNLLEYINKDAFLKTVNLKAINLSNNSLKSLPRNLFKNKNITLFSITENRLEGSISKEIFEGLRFVTKLDISFQGITIIEEYAFFCLEELRTLLLNNNKIRVVSKSSFKNLKKLNELDLSNNLIVSLDFKMVDLFSLESLSLENNIINQIQTDFFCGLNTLRFLDLSNNNISKIAPDSFTSIETIETFQIFNNPLSGALVNYSFHRLSLVPVLDLSYTSLTSILNGSFSGMVQLQDLTISHSSINILEFNAFMNTGSLKLLDLSYNKLTEFNVNPDDLNNLTKIILNNNYLIHISSYAFKNMRFLNKVILSYNSIINIDDSAFANQAVLRYLDLSFNINLTFYVSTIGKAAKLDKLFLSSIKNEIDFTNNGSAPIRELTISHSPNIHNVSNLHLSSIKYLTNLALSNNSIVSLELSSFRNLSLLNWLDLSLNNISYIQPSTFKDNILLCMLNLSHNSLTSLNYGIFRGLDSLNTLDVSFNSILHLQRAQFYDIQKLKVLIVDNNKISEISEDFFHIDFDLLSIGDNPLSCERIAYMKYKEGINVSSINIDETTNHNIDGITCGKNNNFSDSRKLKNNEREQIDIREFLFNLTTKIRNSELPVDNRYSDILKEVVNKLDKQNTDETRVQIQLNNITFQMANEVERSNTLLESILKSIIGLNSQQSKPKIVKSGNATDNKDNSTLFESKSKLANLIVDVNQVQQDLLYLENMVSEIDRKITRRTFSIPLVSENSNSSAIKVQGNKDKSFIFVEVCVSLILIILVCSVLYKVYQTKISISSSRSLSTRRITDSMDNSNL